MSNSNNVANFYKRNPGIKNNMIQIRLHKDLETKSKFNDLKSKTGLTAGELLGLLIDSFTKPKAKK